MDKNRKRTEALSCKTLWSASLGLMVCLSIVPVSDAAPLDRRIDASSRTTSSPFAPPTDDVFVANKGDGLDTGCTFNDDPEHPLIIEVLIDQAVGPVDANGFLENPQALISAGVIPATAEIILPAFDIDVNGAPGVQPERDVISLNGNVLGDLTGDNDIWKLNSFTVNIAEIKFPAPPATPGGTVTPAVNRLQVDIDLFNEGWCAAVDWVALAIPIRADYAVTLTAVSGIPTRENPDNIVYQETFDSDCNVETVLDDFASLPVVGPRDENIRIEATLESCAGTAQPDETIVNWQVAGAGGASMVSGSATLESGSGTFDIRLLDRVAESTIDFDFEVDGRARPTISRRALITYDDNLPTNEPGCRRAACNPKLVWLEKGVDWAMGAQSEIEVVRGIRQGMYANPGNIWKYLDGSNPLDWLNLLENIPTGGFVNANCVGFSYTLISVAAVMGANAGTETQVTRSPAFLTNPKPSVDRDFANAGPWPTGAYNSFIFGMHSLVRKSGLWHDATFDGEYSSNTEFIAAELKSTQVELDGLRWYETDSSILVNIERLMLGEPYFSSWGGVGARYRDISDMPFTVAGAVNAKPASSQPGPIERGMNGNLTGAIAFDRVDDNADGFFDALSATIGLDIVNPGVFTVSATLEKDGVVITGRARFGDMGISFAQIVDLAAGPHDITFEFSGEDIFLNGADGPYQLRVSLQSQSAIEGELVADSPAYAHTEFGERPMSIGTVTDAGVDLDNDGLFDVIRLNVEGFIRVAGTYVVSGAMFAEQDTIATAPLSDEAELPVGPEVFVLDFDAREIRESNQPGPYVAQTTLRRVDEPFFVSQDSETQAYLIDDLTLSLLRYEGGLTDTGVDDNQNGLFEYLDVGLDVSSGAVGDFVVSASITDEQRSVFLFSNDVPVTLGVGAARLDFRFDGGDIRRSELDGPYSIEVTLKDSTGNQTVGRIDVTDPTGVYSHLDFEDADDDGGDGLSLTGAGSDEGVDTNSNGLFDLLRVQVEVNVPQLDSYEWSVRLEDASGTELGFVASSSTLPAGTQLLTFDFDGNVIGANGVNGPYEVRGLLIFGQSSGANLVAADVRTTEPYQASQFEGFEGTVPGDFNDDGVIDVGDFVLLANALGSCARDENYVAEIDLDDSGCIDFYDYRLWYVLYNAAQGIIIRN